MRFFHLRSILLLALFSLLNPEAAFTQVDSVQPQTEIPEEKTGFVDLPRWLISKPFQVIQRTTLHLPGTDESSGIKRTSRTYETFVYLAPDQWRVLREIPNTHNTNEFLMTPEGFYAMSPRNQKITPPRKYDDRLWQKILAGPYQLARQWSLPHADGDWSNWYDSMRALKEPLVNAAGDKMSSKFERQDKIDTLTIEATGVVFQDQTKVHYTTEWTLKSGEGLKLSTKPSLLGGS